MKNILFFASATRQSCNKRIAGVRRYFAKTDCQVQVIEGNYKRINIAKILDFWKPVGCIAECGSDTDSLTPASFGRIPVVFLDKDPTKKTDIRFSVNSDLEGSSVLAAKELLSLDLPAYAFVGFKKPLFWSKARERAFVGAIKLNGRTCRVFDDASTTGMKRMKALCKWLRGLPKPCGIFAAHDATAEETLNACQIEGLSVPEDVAILGVDNIEDICEQTTPTLSSVCQDFEKAGFLCGELLALQLHHPETAPRSLTFGLLGVVRRRSTMRMRTGGTNGQKVSKALELIRQKACGYLCVDDVAAVMGCSRRTAEMRFQKFTHHTIAEEIREVRLAKVFALLRQPEVAINSLANICGYESDSTLRYAFKAKTGLSMRDWRRKNVLAASGRGGAPPFDQNFTCAVCPPSKKPGCPPPTKSV